MNNPQDNTTPDTEAIVKRRRRISPVWLIPLAVALVGCWLVYQNFLAHGPQVTLLLDSAAGLEAGSTAVKVHSVEVGHVESVHLTDDYKGAVAQIQMKPGTAAMLAADSQFWVVKPRISRQGISGLSTILSGAYIQLRPGAKDKTSHRFTALDHPPVTSADADGISLVLTSSATDTVHVGDPVLYQGQTAGRIEAGQFSVADRTMHYRVFIRAPFDQLVTSDTLFWLRSGIDLHIGAQGVDVHAGSIRSIFTGGITFGAPDEAPASADSVQNGAQFQLYATRKAAYQDRFDNPITYLVLLDDSVYGLSDGAPVLFRGLRVGTVKSVPFFPDGYSLSKLKNYRIPVLIAIEPQRVSWVHWPHDAWRSKLKSLFNKGLRATIKPANLLTGAMLISLQFADKPAHYTPRKIAGYSVFPSSPGAISNIQQQIAELLNKLNQLQLGSLTKTVQHTLHTIDKTTGNLNQLLGADDTRHLASEMQATLSSLQNTLSAYQKGAPVYQQLQQSLDHLDRVLEQIAPLANTLKRHPNALIFGRPGNHDPEPKAAP